MLHKFLSLKITRYAIYAQTLYHSATAVSCSPHFINKSSSLYSTLVLPIISYVDLSLCSRKILCSLYQKHSEKLCGLLECCKNSIITCVTGFSKRGLPHTSNCMNSEDHSSVVKKHINLKPFINLV